MIKAIASLIMTVLCWAATPLFLKHFAGQLDGFTVNGIRYLFVVLIWLPVIIRHIHMNSAGMIWKAALIPSFFHVFAQTLWSLTPYYNDVSIIHFVMRSTFLFTILFGFTFIKSERTLAKHLTFWIGVAGCIAGVLIMYKGSSIKGATSLTGMSILMADAICMALYSVSVKKYLYGYPARLSFGVVSLYSAPPIVLLMLTVGDWKELASISGSMWPMLAVSAWIGLAFGHTFLYGAIKRLGPIVTEGGLLLIPFVTATGAAFIYHESMNQRQWIAACFLIGSSASLLYARIRFTQSQPKPTKFNIRGQTSKL